MINAPPTPVPERERIQSLDVLRGVAVLGILALNIQSFSMIGAAYMNPTAYGDFEGANRTMWLIVHLLGDQKFVTIFSMLFGAGIIVMTTRAEETGRGSAAVHYRRMGWLLLFGLLHAHLLWYGDILYFYAICGMIAWLFRKLPPVPLFVIGLISIGLGSAINLLMGWSMQFWPEGQIEAMELENWLPAAERIQHELDTYRGAWLTQMGHRTPTALMFETFLALFFGWKIGGLILVGMGLFKLGIFSAARSIGFYAVMLVLCAGIGLPIVAYGVVQNFAHEWTIEYSFYFGQQWNYWGSLVVSLAWVALVMLVCKTVSARVLRPLAATGRMALTNYLMQTIICTTIFYGHGFGLFGQLERVEQYGIVAAIWVFQLVASPIWLRFFRYGPFEWLWRSLTYWKLQPMAK